MDDFVDKVFHIFVSTKTQTFVNTIKEKLKVTKDTEQ